MTHRALQSKNPPGPRPRRPQAPPTPPVSIRALTPRLRIRRLRRGDAADFLEIFGDPEVARFDDFEPVAPDEIDAEMTAILRSYRYRPRDAHYAAALRDGGKVIGVLYVLVERDGTYIGYHFNRAWHGHGYAREAVEALVRLLETRRAGFPRVRAKVDPQNERSIRLLCKVGFELEATGASPAGAPELVYGRPQPRPRKR